MKLKPSARYMKHNTSEVSVALKQPLPSTVWPFWQYKTYNINHARRRKGLLQRYTYTLPSPSFFTVHDCMFIYGHMITSCIEKKFFILDSGFYRDCIFYIYVESFTSENDQTAEEKCCFKGTLYPHLHFYSNTLGTFERPWFCHSLTRPNLHVLY